MGTFLLTWNPQKWSWDDAERAQAIATTAQGRGFPDKWSIGGRTSGIGPGDRVFLLRQAEQPRGLMASGTVTSDPYQAAHWDNTPGKLANYVDVDWDRVVEEQAALPTAELLATIPNTHWNTQSSGIAIGPPDAAKVEELWQDFLHELVSASSSKGQGWQSDPTKRRAAEDFAQSVLMRHFSAEGWEVHDRRHGNPYDAVAIKDDQRLYLEAKGTQSTGQGVLVTAGEVAFARRHQGECVVGIVSNIRFRSDGEIDETSYDLRLLSWDPQDGDLMPTGYLWRPPTDA